MSLPGRPVIRNAPRASPNTLEYYWFPPTSTGGNPIEGYQLSLNPGGITCNIAASELAPTFGYYKVTGLSNATTYFTTIAASTINGYGPTANFRAFQPGSRPINGPSTTAITVSGTSNILLSWTPPITTPDAPILWYTIKSKSSNPSEAVRKYTANGLTMSNYFVKGLNPNTTYYFTINAVNCPGYSPQVSTTTFSYVPFVPTQISGLKLWIDPFDLSTITFGAGSTITSLKDKSANAYVFSGGNGFIRSTINGGYPSFLGNGTAILGTNASFPMTQTTTAFYVLNRKAARGGDNFIHASGNPVTIGLNYYTGTYGDLDNFYITTNNNYIGLPAAPLTTNAILSVYYNTSASYMYGNGGVNSGSANIGTNTGTGLTFGNIPAGGSGYAGYIGETIFYNSILTPFRRQKVEGYLAWRYGLQGNLPTNHPFYPSQPLSNSVFAPTSFPGLRFWYDGQDSTTIIRTLSSVTQWSDKTGNGFHMYPNSPSTVNYNTNAMNGYPGLYFSTFAGMSTNAYVLSQTSQLSFFIVLRQIGQMATGANAEIFANLANYQVLNLFSRGTTPTDVRLVLGNTTENATGSNITSANTLLDFTTTAASASIYVNGNTPLTFTPGNTALMNSSQPYRLVRSRWIGNICEVFAYSNALNTDDRQTVEGYLAWKWGIQANLPATHPYKNNNPGVAP